MTVVSELHRAHELLAEKYTLQPKEVHGVVRVIVGVVLRQIFENVKSEFGPLKINRAIKAELSELAEIGESTLDKYMGDAYKSCSAFDFEKLLQLLQRLFYQSTGLEFDSFKYLKPHHVGILGQAYESGNLKNVFLESINFIKSQPHIVEQIAKHSCQSQLHFALNKIFLSDKPGRARLIGQAHWQPVLENSRASIAGYAALIVSFLGVALPLFVYAVTSDANKALALDFIIHEPSKHLFHVILLPGCVYLALLNISISGVIYHRRILLCLIVGLVLVGVIQSVLQQAQGVCDLAVDADGCVEIKEILINEPELLSIYNGYGLFLTLLGSCFTSILLSCQLLELKDRHKQIFSTGCYAIVNLTLLFWAVLTAYSEWHLVYASQTPESVTTSTANPKVYSSFLMVYSMLITSQLLIGAQIYRSKPSDSQLLRACVATVVFLIADGAAMMVGSNIQIVASLIHGVNHSLSGHEVSQNNSALINLFVFVSLVCVYLLFIGAHQIKKLQTNSFA